MNELPSITASTYISSEVDSTDWLKQAMAVAPDWHGLGATEGQLQANRQFFNQAIPPVIHQEPTMSARIVKVYIADPNENLPLDKRVLHSGEERLTDLTDQELFYEVPIAELLTKHNAERAKTVDKKQAEKFGRDIYLEPARIRDLKMVVVTVAAF